MHSQKIGNALRTVDTWYPEAAEKGPIAVEPYGSVTTQGKAYRQPKQKMDFYNLLDNWVLKEQEPERDKQHFVIATLIRGGVFGDAGYFHDEALYRLSGSAGRRFRDSACARLSTILEHS